jgi:uncharacterized protein YebE (UPF0316 family)
MLEDLTQVNVLLAAGAIFLLRIVDVSLGTIRTISLVQGRIVLAMGLGFFEVLIWIFVIAGVMGAVRDNPLLLVAYAAGFSAGNGVGILIERRLAMGVSVVRIISQHAGARIADRIREDGQPVTVFTGQGRDGPVSLLYITCARRTLPWFLKEAIDLDPCLFYVVEPAIGLNRRIFGVPHPTGWHAIAKRK